MNIYLFDENKIVTFNLPIKKIGNFWITDDKNENVINIKDEDNNWILSGSNNSKIIASNNQEKFVLREKNYYVIEKNNKRYALFVDGLTDNSFKCFEIEENKVIKFGSDPSNDVSVDIPYFNALHFTLTIENGNWKIEKTENSLVYLNDEVIKTNIIYAQNGDIINAFGIRIILSYKSFITKNTF